MEENPKAELFKQRRHRDSNPVLETRSANHQHLLLFLKKLGKGEKAKPEKTKDCFLRKRKTFTSPSEEHWRICFS